MINWREKDEEKARSFWQEFKTFIMRGALLTFLLVSLLAVPSHQLSNR